DPARAAGVVLDLFAQMADVHAEGVFVPVVIGVPHSAAERVERDDVAAVGSELLQQCALGGGQRQRAAVRAADGGVVQVDAARPQRQAGRSALLQRAAVSAAQDELDAQQKLLREERFG